MLIANWWQLLSLSPDAPLVKS
jgi:hypothetical protein